jgi:hypothetical protein
MQWYVMVVVENGQKMMRRSKSNACGVLKTLLLAT